MADIGFNGDNDKDFDFVWNTFTGLRNWYLKTADAYWGESKGAQFWAGADYSFGALMGTYINWVFYARNGDCFSNFLYTGFSAVSNYHSTFVVSGPAWYDYTPVDKAIFGTNTALFLYQVWLNGQTCILQHT